MIFENSLGSAAIADNNQFRGHNIVCCRYENYCGRSSREIWWDGRKPKTNKQKHSLILLFTFNLSSEDWVLGSSIYVCMAGVTSPSWAYILSKFQVSVCDLSRQETILGKACTYLFMVATWILIFLPYNLVFPFFLYVMHYKPEPCALPCSSAVASLETW